MMMMVVMMMMVMVMVMVMMMMTMMMMMMIFPSTSPMSLRQEIVNSVSIPVMATGQKESASPSGAFSGRSEISGWESKLVLYNARYLYIKPMVYICLYMYNIKKINMYYLYILHVNCFFCSLCFKNTTKKDIIFRKQWLYPLGTWKSRDWGTHR